MTGPRLWGSGLALAAIGLAAPALALPTAPPLVCEHLPDAPACVGGAADCAL